MIEEAPTAYSTTSYTANEHLQITEACLSRDKSPKTETAPFAATLLRHERIGEQS